MTYRVNPLFFGILAVLLAAAFIVSPWFLAGAAAYVLVSLIATA